MTKKRLNKSKHNPLQIQRNRIRGLIGASKSTEFFLAKSRSRGKDNIDRAGHFQRALVGVLIKSRSELAATQFEEFLSWMESQTSTQAAKLNNVGALNSELLQEVLASHPLPLPNEVLWIVSRLIHHNSFLQGFIREKELLEDLYWEGDWVKIKNQLALIEQTYGRSLWILEVKITLTQEFEGLEAQKKIASAERKTRVRSLSAYIAHHFSVRNEPSTNLSRNVRELFNRIERLAVNDALRAFLKFKLLDPTGLSELDACKVLQIAQGLSEVDLYEILLEVCQTLALVRKPTSSVKGLIKALDRLSSIGDNRIVTLIATLSEKNLPTTLSKNDILLTIPSLREGLRVLKSNPRDARTAILLAAQLIKIRKPTSNPSFCPRWPIFIRQMAAALRFDSTYESDLDTVEKNLSNHRFLTTATVCLHLFKAELTFSSEDSILHRRRAMLCNPLGIYPSGSDASASNKIMPNPEVFKGKDKPRWVTVLKVLSELQTAIGMNDLGLVSQELTHLYLNHIVPLYALPLQMGIGSARWRQLKRFHNQLSLAIALHLCWRATDSDLAATNLRFAYDEILDAYCINSPTELIQKRNQFNLQELIYFLRNICVVNVMDMSQRVSSSRAAEVERQEVCKALCELDPPSRIEYQAEILEIEQSLSLQDGRTIVDSSRVHVDTAALIAWSKRELGSDFRRYEELVRAGIGTAGGFDDLLRAIRSTDSQPAYLEVPESEADDVLVGMMMILRERFLLDPHHGLDSYLSRRVRHHSMTGYLRGPVEEQSLITSKSSRTSRYVENTYWVERLGGSTLGDKAQISRCFESFAEDFDRTVLRLKNELFHVYSLDHPNGIFRIGITAPMVHIVRSAVQADMSLEAFCNICFTIFWASLDASLSEAQRHLCHETKQELSSSFQRLRTSLRKAVNEQSRYAEVSIIIQNAAENVQREIDKMAEWFMRRELQQSDLLYSIDKLLDIAIASALASHRPFDPQITKDVTCNYHLRTDDLILIAEIVLTALGNVKGHSSTRKQPFVNIIAHCSEDEEIFTLRIENNVEGSALTAEACKRVEDIRMQIEDGSYVSKIRSEGGTGLLKIAGSVQQSKKGRLDFGFVNGNHFFVETKFSFIKENSENPEATVGRLTE